MPQATPVPSKSSGDVFTATMWNSYLRDNINKLLDRGHRVLTVAQFAALTSPEGTKGTLAPDEVYVEVDATNGVQWHFAYESGETTYKWRFLGGPPMWSEITTAEATTSATYAALATAGPSVALPRSGDYDVRIGYRLTTAGGGDAGSYVSYDIGGVGAVDGDAVITGTGGANSSPGHVGPRSRRKTGLTPVTLTAKYKGANTVTRTFADRSMSVRPVRIRHDA